MLSIICSWLFDIIDLSCIPKVSLCAAFDECDVNVYNVISIIII